MLSLTKTFSDILKRGEALNWRYVIKIEQAIGDDHVNMLSSGGLDTAGAGPPVMLDWVDSGFAAQIARETSLQRLGDSCVKLTYTVANGWAGILQTFTTVASTNYILTFYSRGDGSDAGRYQVYDVSNTAFLITERTTGVTGTGWTKVTQAFTTVGGGVSTRIGLISNTSTDNAVAYFDDIHVQLASDYYYFSDQEFEIVDLTANDIVRGVLKDRDILTLQQMDIRRQTASIGGFSIRLIDDGLNDLFNSNKIYNRPMWIYLGTSDLASLDDYQLLYKGEVRDFFTERDVIEIDVSNSEEN